MGNRKKFTKDEDYAIISSGVRKIKDIYASYKIEIITFSVVVLLIGVVLTFGIAKFAYNVYVDETYIGKVDSPLKAKEAIRKSLKESEKEVSVYPVLSFPENITPEEEIVNAYAAANGVKRGVALSLDDELIFAANDEQLIFSVINEYMATYKDEKSVDAKIDAKVEIIGGYFSDKLFTDKTEARSRLLMAGKDVLVTRDDGAVLKNGIDENDIWNMPVSAPVSSHFGQRWGKMHNGTDFAADEGDTICAAKGGEVTFSAYNGGYGNLVIIDHGEGMETYYAHMSEILVKKGDKVKRGEVIGKVGNTGNSTGPHLHFEVRVDNIAQNPMDFMGF